MSLGGNPTTQRENTKGDEDSARSIVITCNSHKAEFYPSKFKKMGKVYVNVSSIKGNGIILWNLRAHVV